MSIALENQLDTILRPTFGDEVYPIVHPDMDGLCDSVTDTFCVWSLSGGSIFDGLAGYADLMRVRVQISIYANTFSLMKTAQRAVMTAMNNANTQASNNMDVGTDFFNTAGSLPNTLISPPDEGREVDTKRFYTLISFYCWTKE